MSPSWTSGSAGTATADHMDDSNPYHFPTVENHEDPPSSNDQPQDHIPSPGHPNQEPEFESGTDIHHSDDYIHSPPSKGKSKNKNKNKSPSPLTPLLIRLPTIHIRHFLQTLRELPWISPSTSTNLTQLLDSLSTHAHAHAPETPTPRPLLPLEISPRELQTLTTCLKPLLAAPTERLRNRILERAARKAAVRCGTFYDDDDDDEEEEEEKGNDYFDSDDPSEPFSSHRRRRRDSYSHSRGSVRLPPSPAGPKRPPYISALRSFLPPLFQNSDFIRLFREAGSSRRGHRRGHHRRRGEGASLDRMIADVAGLDLRRRARLGGGAPYGGDRGGGRTGMGTETEMETETEARSDSGRERRWRRDLLRSLSPTGYCPPPPPSPPSRHRRRRRHLPAERHYPARRVDDSDDFYGFRAGFRDRF